jgi:A/G-specific adenine glycosylase
MNADFTRKLLQWNSSENDRKMPWKGEKNPYKIWLSEIMLQQTRVEQGWAYYEKFIGNFPTIHHLAKAPDEKVFKLWEGLGYYSRCKNLIETARIIVNQYQGIFPSDYDSIKALKGIGPYTAAAIASFAYNLPYAVVDGNVQRILARYFGITTPVDSTKGKKLFDQLAQALLDTKNPARYNQAIMDFGATVCKPQNPLCHQCVQKKECVAFELEQVKTLPIKEKKLQKKDRWFTYYLVVVGNKIYIRKRMENDIWQNLYEFLLSESDTHPRDEVSDEYLKRVLGKQPYSIVAVSKTYRQQLSHQNIHGRFILVKASKESRELKLYTATELKKIRQYAFPGLINKFLEKEPGILSF